MLCYLLLIITLLGWSCGLEYAGSDFIFIESSNGDGDDIVFSSSGCHYEDEEECVNPGSGATSTDSLVSPVIDIHTTSRPGQHSTPTPQGLVSAAPPGGDHESSGDCDDDDEDCEVVHTSGGKQPQEQSSTEDIGFSEVPTDGADPGPNPGANSTEDVEVIKVDMTETPSRRKPAVLTEDSVTTAEEEITESAPIRKQTEIPSGSSSTTTKAQPSSVGGGKTGKAGSNTGHSSSLGMNIGLIVGIVAGVMVLLLIFAYLCYKYRSRDEGSYKIDETKNYSYETCNTKPSPQLNGGTSKSKSHSSSKPRKKDIKEWYV